MKKIICNITFLFIFTIIINNCASPEKPPQKSNLTVGVVKTKIVKGQTTQNDIVNLLGSPNIITKNAEGNEVWTYSRQSYDAEAGSIGGSIIIFGGSKAFSSSSSATFDLIITFDQKSIVKDYSVVSSKF